MAIFVSEPGRPVGTRLPEVFRGRRVGNVTELVESHAVNTGHSDVTDGEFQQASYAAGHHRALEEYGASAEPRDQRSYLPVSTLCTPALYSLPATATIAEALSTMDEHGVHHLVITAQDNVAGLIDLRWLLSWLHEHNADAMSHSLLHVELPAFLTASPETDAHQLARLMLAHQLNAALVVDNKGLPSGIVTSTDYLKLYASAGRQQGTV
ncbi:CBS domain-containing protein [Marinobacter lipolyticus]|uniref:CBS domain-containing protein n=1 Tax=Marinobacter lipolyticus TaxID=209639 RepID=UPI001BCBB45B|nr:CBS domain-containing protein [Marinobacter lipolyticus]MBS8239252.1 CBS domain-containing protein [Marinobacter lipolyticus]